MSESITRLADNININWEIVSGPVAQSVQNGSIDPAWYQSGYFVFFVLLALVAIFWYIGQAAAKSMRLAEYGTRLSVIMVCIVLASLVVGLKWPPKLGVDLKGGMTFIGSLDLGDLQNDPSAKPPEAKDIVPTLLERVDPSGTREIMIRPLGSDKIEVTIPSVSSAEADEIWNRLISAGHLQFRIAADTRYHANILQIARDEAGRGNNSRYLYDATARGDKAGRAIGGWYSLARDQTASKNKTQISKELLPFKFVPGASHLMRDKSTGRIISNAEIPYGQNPDDWGMDLATYCLANGFKPQVLMVEPPEERADVEGEHLDSVRSGFDEYGRPCINFGMSAEGSKRLGFLTSTNRPDNSGGKRLLGIVLDKQLHSAPSIDEPIYASGRISGSFTKQEVDDLIVKLRSGKLEVALNDNPISKEYVESTLGNELKNKGVWAIGASFMLVLVFMMFYYRFSGFVACGALLLNLLLIMALIMAIRQPLTLTGLAGLVLTVGMSVDANVLIFERIREELARGSALRMAIRNGFDKATTTIVDANVTTLITALVLYAIGTEQIKGFSVTLILGILMSMFTAIYCSRTVFDICERKRWLTKISMMKILNRSKFDFLGKRMVTGFCSVVLIIAGIVGMYFLGSKILNHDLRGGSTARMVLKQGVEDTEEIRKILDSQKIEALGEEIEFTVSKISSDDPEMKDRVYKIDSNLRTWDGEGEAPYKDLSGMLSDIFKDKLTLLHVDVGEIKSNTPQSEPTVLPQSPTNGDAGNDQENSTGMIQKRAPAWVSMATLATPIALLQDEGAGAAKQDDTTSDETADQDQPKTDTAAGDDTQDPATQDAPGSGGAFPANANNARRTTNVVSTTLKFGQKISGSGVKTLLSEAAVREDYTLEEDQIKVKSPDAGPDDEDDKVVSETWNVEMTMPNQSEAEKLLKNWSSEYNSKPYFPTSSGVGGQIAGQSQRQALAAIIASLLGIIAYVWIRFQNIAFGLAAVVALIHDVLIVLGAIALSHYVAGALGFLLIDNFKISLPIVAALLTIIGYSLNDTIVVFDRIREVRGKRPEITADMINTSISQTLSRTILTSVTTFIVVFILYWFGGDAIHGFAFSLVVGVIVGTYSSIFVASPTLLWLMNKVGLNPGSAVVTE